MDVRESVMNAAGQQPVGTLSFKLEAPRLRRLFADFPALIMIPFAAGTSRSRTPRNGMRNQFTH